LRGAHIQNLGTNPDAAIPSEKQFYLGGTSTLRGFDPGDIPPEYDAEGNLVKVLTDSHYYLFKTEVSFPIYGSLRGVIFYDGGAIKISGHRFEDEYRDSAGAGIRYVTPVGPVSLEYGYKLDRKRKKPLDESEGRIHFSIGTF
jgi:outer membrane protein assembly factor BamA